MSLVLKQTAVLAIRIGAPARCRHLTYAGFERHCDT